MTTKTPLLLELREQSTYNSQRLYLRGDPVNFHQLADTVKCDTSFLAKIFSRSFSNRPSLKVAGRLAGALGVSLDELHLFLRDIGKAV